MSDRRIYPDELCHYGILGMKWGKRNGPPYPLDAKDHSASEKKAGWRQSLKDKIRDRDDEYRYRQATKIRRQLDGSVPGGMQIRKLGRSQYKIEPVDPNQRRKIYKNGTIVPDYEKASEKKAGWRQSLSTNSDSKKEIRNEYRKAMQNKVRGTKKAKDAEEEAYKRIRQKYGKEGETYARRYGRSEKASALIGAGAGIANSALMLANATGRKKMNPYIQAGLLATMGLSLYNQHLR